MINDKTIVFEFRYPETVRGLCSDVRYKTSYNLSRKGYKTIASVIKRLFDNTRCELTARIDDSLVADLIAANGAFELYLYNKHSTIPYKVMPPKKYVITEPEVMPVDLAQWITMQIFVYARHNFR